MVQLKKDKPHWVPLGDITKILRSFGHDLDDDEVISFFLFFFSFFFFLFSFFFFLFSFFLLFLFRLFFVFSLDLFFVFLSSSHFFSFS